MGFEVFAVLTDFWDVTLRSLVVNIFNFAFIQCHVILSSLKCSLGVVSFLFSVRINIYSYVKMTVTRLQLM